MKQRLITLLILAAGSIVLLLLALTFAATALYFLLSEYIPPIWAALSVAGIALSLAAAAVLSAYFALQKAKEKMKRAARISTMAALAPAAVRTAAKGLGGLGGLGGLAAMVVGHLASRRRKP